MVLVNEFAIGVQPQEAISFLADMRNLPSWDPNALGAEKTSVGAVGVATTFRIRIRLLGVPMNMDYSVVDLDLARQVTLRSESRSGTSTDRFEITGDGGTIRYTAEICFRGPGRIFEPLTRWYFARWARAAAKRMGAVLASPPERS